MNQMKNNLSRRRFLQRSALAGAAAIVAPDLFAGVQHGTTPSLPDIAVVNGSELFKNTVAAIGELGGMSRFVKPGNRVGLLVNSDFTLPSTYVHPDIVLAAIHMCLDAGASSVVSLQNIKDEYWTYTPSAGKYESLIRQLEIISANQFPCTMEAGCFTPTILRDPVIVREAEMLTELDNVDVLINIPVGKHHPSTLITGAMKNIMGVNSRTTNVTFHLNGPERNDPEYLARCIADINRHRPSDLVICDATSFIVTGGPSGPGDVVEPWKIIAGTDMVAIDAMVAELHGYPPADIFTCRAGEERGLGTIDYTKLNIREI
ncbi:MAG: DUF362 domain-containing protein [Bacteroidales bacterium]|nr:DUF362 domain-containing protein [Bacteroidales bacterium]